VTEAESAEAEAEWDREIAARPKWENVNNLTANGPTTKRLAVPGGWLYLVDIAHREPCAVFVPEPLQHHFHLQPNHVVHQMGSILEINTASVYDAALEPRS
jgi:hypothetical protein